MPRVKIAYSPQLHEIGTVRDVDDDTARQLVAEGRAVYYEGPDDPVEVWEDPQETRAAEQQATPDADGGGGAGVGVGDTTGTPNPPRAEAGQEPDAGRQVATTPGPQAGTTVQTRPAPAKTTGKRAAATPSADTGSE